MFNKEYQCPSCATSICALYSELADGSVMHLVCPECKHDFYIRITDLSLVDNIHKRMIELASEYMAELRDSMAYQNLKIELGAQAAFCEVECTISVGANDLFLVDKNGNPLPDTKVISAEEIGLNLDAEDEKLMKAMKISV